MTTLGLILIFAGFGVTILIAALYDKYISATFRDVVLAISWFTVVSGFLTLSLSGL